MTDAEVRFETARVKKFFRKWNKALGLRWWTEIKLATFAEALPPYEDEDKTASDMVRAQADCKADWRYLHATVRVSLPKFVGLSDDDAERVIVHELCHILVNEMREDGIDHEERVVTQLSQAFLWVRDLEREEAKKAKRG